MGFASQLRKLREAAGLSQPALAERAGISFDSIQNWEQGRTRPRLEALGRLARALGATVDALLATGEEAADNPRPRGRPRKEQGAEDAAAEGRVKDEDEGSFAESCGGVSLPGVNSSARRQLLAAACWTPP